MFDSIERPSSLSNAGPYREAALYAVMAGLTLVTAVTQWMLTGRMANYRVVFAPILALAFLKRLAVADDWSSRPRQWLRAAVIGINLLFLALFVATTYSWWSGRGDVVMPFLLLLTLLIAPFRRRVPSRLQHDSGPV